MRPLPTGTVTFLFTDIEGSTALWERDRDAMRAALERHDALLRSVIEARGGHVFKTVGDAFCAVFARAQDALEAAVEGQRLLGDADWSSLGDAGPLRIRMGLHSGEAEERGGDYYGPPVNRAARLEAAGHGGQVLLSQTTRLIVRDRLPEGCTIHDWGEHRLKDLRHTEHIFQLRGPGLPEIDVPPVTAEALHPRDRVRIAEPAPGSAPGDEARDRGAGGTWAKLESALRSDEGEAVTLTPEEAQALARHKPTDWREYRLGRVAEWSQPRYRLDGRFVGLTLLVDRGEEAAQGRWQAREERYEDLEALLVATAAPAIVVLGPPGGGKSTLLRRLELDMAIAGLRGEGEAGERVSFLAALNGFKPDRPGDPLPDPGDWLAAQWRARYPDLPALDPLLAQGRVTLLLDALNEMPAPDERGFLERVRLWKAWLQQLALTRPGNRVVFSCRSLDYSQPLSTPELRVPQVRIEPLGDEQVRGFLVVYSPGRWREIWQALEGSPQLEVLRSPYFLALLVEQVETTGQMPAGRSALFTGFVRQALRREVERGSPLFEPGELLTSRDLRRIAQWRWKGAYDLPERGVLIPKLAELGHAMQQTREDGGGSQVRVDYDEALDLLDDNADEAIVEAGEALSVLDEDAAAGELMYIHQLVQEYFAARALARRPDPELVRVEWRAAAIPPGLEAVLDGLDPGDLLPPLPGTGWEETTILAAAMAEDPPAFVREQMVTNLVVAGRAAAQPELLPLLPAELLDELRWALVARSRDPEADLRHRIACGLALGDLGDPRFERRTGPLGPYLLPPMIEIPAGAYPIGSDEAVTAVRGSWTSHMPRHEVELGAFAIGQFPVTNAEWRCFLEAGGYEDDRWWDTEAGRAWRRGENTAAGVHAAVRHFVAVCRKQPGILDQLLASGGMDKERYELGQRRLAMSEEELEAHLIEAHPSERLVLPMSWRDARFNRPTQPVVGISWYDARAYLRWLSEQSGRDFRLPSEVEWEAAARGREGRAYPYGDRHRRLHANSTELQIRQTTPVGIFPDGDTPEGVADLAGNTADWTSSAYGRFPDAMDHPYPYDPEDGREAAETEADLQRVVRGGSWSNTRSNALAVLRLHGRPDVRASNFGLRAALSLAAPSRRP